MFIQRIIQTASGFLAILMFSAYLFQSTPAFQSFQGNVKAMKQAAIERLQGN